MEANKQSDIEDLEKQAKTKLTLLMEDEEKKDVLSGIMDELSNLFSEFRCWMKTNMDPEVLEPHIVKLKNDSEALFMKAKTKVQSVADNPEVKMRFNDGKDKILDVSTKIAHTVSDTAHDVLNQENVKKVIDTVTDNVSHTVNSIANDERVKEGVGNLKHGTLKLAESAFNGLKKLLDDTTDEDKQ